MARFGETLSKLMKQYGMPAKILADKIGYQESNISKILSKTDVNTELLEKACRVFCVSPMMFLSNDLANYPNVTDKGSYNNNAFNNNALLGVATMNIGPNDEIQNLQRIIEEKETLLQEKERFIQYLLKEKGNN